METTVGQLLLRDALPADIYPENTVLDKGSLKDILGEAARKYPDRYKEILEKISQIGRDVAWEEGTTVSLSGISSSRAKERVLAPIRKKIKQVLDNESLSTEQRNKRLVDLVAGVGPDLQQALLEEAKEEGDNPFYAQIASGGRGNVASLSSLRGADLLSEDQHGDPVPVPILHSYGEGLTPAEYFATTYGQRRGMIDTKMAVADSGYLAKQLAGATHRQVVTRDKPHESRLPVGFPVKTADKENIGAVLAADAGPFKAGHLIDARTLTQLKKQGIDDLLIHSPLTDLSEDGGISSYAAGSRDRVGLAEVGDNIGLKAAQAMSERLSQGLLDCLPTGTLVYKGFGQEFQVATIESLLPNDIVLGVGLDRAITPTRVVNLMNKGTVAVYSSVFTNTQAPFDTKTLLSSLNHKVLANVAGTPTPVEVGSVGINGQIFTANAWNGPQASCVPADRTTARTYELTSQTLVGDQQCWDIEVAHPDSLFVLAGDAADIVVSNSKHSAGVSVRVPKSGFEYINRLIQAPENFPGAGPLAEEEGEVVAVKEAPQGGHNVLVGDRTYYLGAELTPLVKPGDRVEPGDDLSDGVPHPEPLVRLRGLGEARRVYTQALHEALANSGAGQKRRNVESVVAGLLNWGKVTNPNGIGDNIVDDIVPFNRLVANYKPRRTAKLQPVSTLQGKYIEEPVLHYTPGTRVTKRMLMDLKKWGIKDVLADDDPPDFEPYMVRGVHSVYHDPDYRTRLSGFYTSSAFTDAVRRGVGSDASGTSYMPALADAKSFGDALSVAGKYAQAAGDKPKAVIVTGNPSRNSADLRDGTLYPELHRLLEGSGYAVSYDPGEPYTVPDETAALWVGHSRGADRLRFAPDGLQTIAIGSKQEGSINHPDDVVDIEPDEFDQLPANNRQAHRDWHPSMRDALIERLRSLRGENNSAS